MRCGRQVRVLIACAGTVVVFWRGASTRATRLLRSGLSATRHAATGGLQGHTLLHVATTGSDDNDGTLASPFATLHRAQLAVREAIPWGNVTVHIAPGLYTLSRPLEMGLADAPAVGSSHRVTWRATRTDVGESGSVILSGGAELSFDAEQHGLWMSDVRQLPRRAVLHARQLYVEGRRASRSAQAGGGCLAANGSTCVRPLPVWGERAWQWYTDARARRTSSGYLILDPARAREALAWPAKGKGVEFVYTGVGGSPWSESRCPVAEVSRWRGDPRRVGAVLVRMAQPCFRCFQAARLRRVCYPSATHLLPVCYPSAASAIRLLFVRPCPLRAAARYPLTCPTSSKLHRAGTVCSDRVPHSSPPHAALRYSTSASCRNGKGKSRFRLPSRTWGRPIFVPVSE